MRYRLSMPAPHTHLFHVEVRVEDTEAGCEIVFPLWTPGSYLVREFQRHVEQLVAEDAEGRRLSLERIDKHRFRLVRATARRLVLRFKVYANELSVRTAHLDGTHGYLNGTAVFPYVRGHEGRPHALEILPPPGWRVATALDGGPTEFSAKDYDELVDSPIEIGTHRTIGFEALGVPHEIAVWGRGNLDEARLAADAARIVETAGKVVGGLPYDRYLIVLHLSDRRRGGLEHARSTTLQVQRTGFFPAERYEETLGLLAHEHFHAWNVKGLRPAALLPYDYAREQYTRLLWWFEGATSYFENVVLARAGLLTPERWLEHLGKALTSLERTPGARKSSVEEASFLAWVKLYRPDENTPNSTISYYLKGELVAFALDLALRRVGRSLDELLRTMYARYRQKGVPEDGVEQIAAEMLGAAAARSFFDRFVRGTEPLALDLGVIGLRTRRRVAGAFDDEGGKPARPDGGRPPPGFLGAVLTPAPRLAVQSVREGSPAHLAGLYAEDEIVAVDGLRAERTALWDRLCEKGPGGSLELTVFRRDELTTVPVVLGSPVEDAIWLEPMPGAGERERAAFEAWCGARWPESG